MTICMRGRPVYLRIGRSKLKAHSHRMDDDTFDPARLRLSTEAAASIGKKPSDKQKGRHLRGDGPFVQLQLEGLVAASKALGSSMLLVWIHLQHRAWAEKKRTVAVTSQALGELGVDRGMKHRALRLLEEAGLVSVEWRKRRNPLVTLL